MEATDISFSGRQCSVDIICSVSSLAIMDYKRHGIGKHDVVLEAFELSTIHASATLLHESTKKGIFIIQFRKLYSSICLRNVSCIFWYLKSIYWIICVIQHRWSSLCIKYCLASVNVSNIPSGQPHYGTLPSCIMHNVSELIPNCVCQPGLCWTGFCQSALTHCGLVMAYDNRAIYQSTLARVMACCLIAWTHYLNQCWFLISEVLKTCKLCNYICTANQRYLTI